MDQKRGLVLVLKSALCEKKRVFFSIMLIFLGLGIGLALINTDQYKYTQFISIANSSDSGDQTIPDEKIGRILAKINNKYIMIVKGNKHDNTAIGKLTINATSVSDGGSIALTTITTLKERETVQIFFSEITRLLSQDKNYFSTHFTLESPLIISQKPVNLSKAIVIYLSILLGFFFNLIIFCIHEITVNPRILCYDP